ncbi:hypothetical protein T4C_11379 [Trichinella pseudospiralis]|uniref:Uncharacterized protein n=1 Tax=Trichinella pseudospiralis TaxID=6337 RepID=A0A0V1ISM6_TRIPS|nr:hypothetical protein T4C_11379 [Trichinella pseudospiralis]
MFVRRITTPLNSEQCSDIPWHKKTLESECEKFCDNTIPQWSNIDYQTPPQSKTSSLHSVWTVCSSTNNFEKNLKTFS